MKFCERITWVVMVLLNSPYALALPYPYQKYTPIISFNLDPIQNLNTSIRIAARENRVDELKKLLFEKGADVNSVSDRGMTALMFSARNCYPETTKLLIESNADIDFQDKLGRTAVMHAISASCYSVVKLIVVQKTVDLTLKDKTGKSALDYAIKYSVEEVDGPSIKILNLIRKLSQRSKKER